MIRRIQDNHLGLVLDFRDPLAAVRCPLFFAGAAAAFFDVVFRASFFAIRVVYSA